MQQTQNGNDVDIEELQIIRLKYESEYLKGEKGKKKKWKWVIGELIKLTHSKLQTQYKKFSTHTNVLNTN